MTREESKQILLLNRPNRPQKTEGRQLQQAIDVIVATLDEYSNLLNSMRVVYKQHGKWIVNPNGDFVCDNCSRVLKVEENFCPNCGAKMRKGDRA